ncbi:MAG: hypothetical protein WCI73_15750, partial [Phycisphaerae bacterium]
LADGTEGLKQHQDALEKLFQQRQQVYADERDLVNRECTQLDSYYGLLGSASYALQQANAEKNRKDTAVILDGLTDGTWRQSGKSYNVLGAEMVIKKQQKMLRLTLYSGAESAVLEGPIVVEKLGKPVDGMEHKRTVTWNGRPLEVTQTIEPPNDLWFVLQADLPGKPVSNESREFFLRLDPGSSKTTAKKADEKKPADKSSPAKKGKP